MVMKILEYCAWISVITVMISSNLHQYVTAIDGTTGVNYGMLGNNLPPPSEVVAMYRQYKINKMRIFAPDPTVLNALQADATQYGPDDCIHVYVGTDNKDLGPLASGADIAMGWVEDNIVPYPNVCFDYVTAGNEVVGNEEASGSRAAYIAPAIRNLRIALDGKGFSSIGVSTVVHSAVICDSYPPSKGAFSGETVNDMKAILKEISVQSQVKLMINIYPYFAYTSNPNVITLDYALFTSNKPVVQDGPLAYYNLFDAMVDGFYFAMEKVGFNSIGVTITESGWPSAGKDQYSTTVGLARTYNSNLKARIDNGMGTPKRPGDRLLAFIFALFNENQKPGALTERNFGLFYPNKTSVYPIFYIHVSGFLLR